MPIVVIVFVHFLLYYILSLTFLRRERKQESDDEVELSVNEHPYGYCTLKPILGMELLMAQLLFSVYFAIYFDVLYQDHPYLAQYLCIYYPMIIGAMKAIQTYCVKEYDVESIYEFISLAMAAFPYKFLFISVDIPIVAASILVIKFGYKATIYIGAYLPFYIKCKKKLNCCKKNKDGDQQPSDYKLQKLETRNFMMQSGKKATKGSRNDPFNPKLDMSTHNPPKTDERVQNIIIPEEKEEQEGFEDNPNDQSKNYLKNMNSIDQDINEAVYVSSTKKFLVNFSKFPIMK